MSVLGSMLLVLVLFNTEMDVWPKGCVDLCGAAPHTPACAWLHISMRMHPHMYICIHVVTQTHS